MDGGWRMTVTRDQEVDAVLAIFQGRPYSKPEYSEDGSTLMVSTWGDVTFARLKLMAELIGHEDIQVYGGTVGERDGSSTDAAFIEWRSTTEAADE